MSLILPKRLSRRQVLQLSGASSLGWLLNGCVLNQFSDQVGELSEPLNQAVETLMLSQKPVPEYPLSAIAPDSQLLINTYNNTPQIDPAKFRLAINGEVNNPLQLSLADLQKMPLTTMVIQHVCVEGWAAIVQWGGVRLRDLISLAQPKAGARYVYFASADGYTESWDLASSVHPQTLMAYQKNGAPLPVDHGAPLRLAAPIKLGYKQSKWVTEITLVNQLAASKGYWEDEGYEWFGGV
jgi:DMSO/TMAO reductase YedYZ molybdopterin-dependent catalytic subunit